MIAHPLKTVFVHIPKTAGYSVEQVFLSYLGLDQNARAALLLREKRDYEAGPPRLSHLTAAEYESGGFLTAEQRTEYFFFTTVRNPWSRVRSFYHYLKFDRDHSLEDFVLNHLEDQMCSDKYAWFLRPQTEFIYDDDDQLLVDLVCRFERLDADFESVLTRIGLPPTELPVANSTQAGTVNTTKDIGKRVSFSAASIEKIAQLYRRDVELLNYDTNCFIDTHDDIAPT